MNNPISFNPAASVKIVTAAGAVAQPFAMPPVDAANPDLRVTNNSAGTAIIAFSKDAVVSLEQPGCLIVKPGKSALITAKPDALALNREMAEIVLPHGRYTPQAWLTGYGEHVAAATDCKVLFQPHGAGEITITRGTATAGVQF